MKHTPATPLPWVQRESNGSISLPSPTTLNGKLDRKYLVHAANAYPKLVEALKQARETIDVLNNGADTFRMSANIGILLRELGEL